MNSTREVFVGIRPNYEIIYLMDCNQCDMLVTSQYQAHNDIAKEPFTDDQKIEAAYFAELIHELKGIYPIPVMVATTSGTYK